jgi:DNA-binding PadR family transcriptional regulator
LIVEILSDGRERTRSEIESEIEKRTGMRPASGPVSGRLSELAKEGVIVKLKRGNLWYWKMAGGGGLE